MGIPVHQFRWANNNYYVFNTWQTLGCISIDFSSKTNLQMSTNGWLTLKHVTLCLRQIWKKDRCLLPWVFIFLGSCVICNPDCEKMMNYEIGVRSLLYKKIRGKKEIQKLISQQTLSWLLVNYILLPISVRAVSNMTFFRAYPEQIQKNYDTAEVISELLSIKEYL